MLAILARLSIFLSAAMPQSDSRTGDPRTEPLATLRFENGADAKPTGLVISTAVAFAPGAVPSCDGLGIDAPAEIQPLERHRDGSVSWARVRVLPSWKALRSSFVEIRTGGVRPPLPSTPPAEVPRFRLVLEDFEGVERIAEVGAALRPIEKSALREASREGGRHRLSSPKAGALEELFGFEVFVERFAGESFVFMTLVLRNDPPAAPWGPLRFRSYRIEPIDPNVTITIAWPELNGCALEKRADGGARGWLLPRGTKDLWLGDGQTKAWRILLDASGNASRTPALARALEKPMLPGMQPAYLIRTQTWGDSGAMVLGPPPQAAARQAQDEFARARKSREYGWNGAFGDVKGTHQTGSPRNGLSSDGVLRTLQTGMREWFDLTFERAVQQSLRPIVRSIRAADHPNVLLFEGMPHPKWPDRLGREIPLDPRLAAWREGTSGSWMRETHGWNGFDEEHFTVDDLYAVHLLTGDPWVRFELESIGQAILTYPFAKKAVASASARSDGWLLRGLVQLHRVTGDRAYLDAASQLVRGMDARRGKGEIKYLNEAAPDPRQLTNHPFEMPWQVAIAVNGLVYYFEQTGDPLARTIALDAADFLVKDGWNPKTGVFKRCVATDGSGAFLDEREPGGTQSWIASALVAAYRLEPKPEYRILADGLYRVVKATNATFDRGGQQWSWWQSYLRWAFDSDAARRPAPASGPANPKDR